MGKRIEAAELEIDERASTLLDFFLYSGLPIGGIAVAFIAGTYALIEIPPSPPLLVAGFCGAYLVYLFDRTLGFSPEDAQNHPGRSHWVKNNRKIIRWSAVGALLSGGLTIPFLNGRTLVACSVFVLLGLVYVVPLLPGRRRLKAWSHWKTFCITAGWSFGGVILPVLQAGRSVSTAVLLLLVYRFLFVLPNVLLSDVPDRPGDTRAGLQTFATRLPERRFRLITRLPPALAVAGAVGAVLSGWGPVLLLVDAAGPLLIFFFTFEHPHSDHPHHQFYLDLLMAWPCVTAITAVFIY